MKRSNHILEIYLTNTENYLGVSQGLSTTCRVIRLVRPTFNTIRPDGHSQCAAPYLTDMELVPFTQIIL